MNRCIQSNQFLEFRRIYTDLPNSPKNGRSCHSIQSIAQFDNEVSDQQAFQNEYALAMLTERESKSKNNQEQKFQRYSEIRAKSSSSYLSRKKSVERNESAEKTKTTTTMTTID
uniref:Uncharacterized protein n=1 Tax=Opuntia streptacantha TaxID=393608 RepID=A0A7C9A6H2_OPUST